MLLGENKLLDYPSLQVVDELPFCQRCGHFLPRCTSDPCRDPGCPLANMSLNALWHIIEHRGLDADSEVLVSSLQPSQAA